MREVKERVEGLTKEHDICNKEVRDQMDMLERVREERNEVVVERGRRVVGSKHIGVVGIT